MEEIKLDKLGGILESSQSAILKFGFWGGLLDFLAVAAEALSL